MNGWYDFGSIATNRTYRLEISGPGIQPQTRQIEIAYVPGIEGRRYFHFPVIRSQKDLATVQPVEVFLPKQIAPDARTIEDFYSHIPGITYEDGYLIDENGGTVCLMFNGLIPTNPNEYEVLMNASTALNVTRIEYYRFDYAETPYYDSALNFVLNLTINVPDISDPDWGL
ncbi:hypothetical protein [Alistipes putredinis]|uniref:hypothetical protein n=1 Tax=Alistipes putredinis TaxID=28117 RepID=UPI003AB6C777